MENRVSLRIRELEERAQELEAALKPFAALCEWLSDAHKGPNYCTDNDVLLVTDWEVPPDGSNKVTAGMIRTARRALRWQQAQGQQEDE